MLEEIVIIRYNSFVGVYDQVNVTITDGDDMASAPMDLLLIFQCYPRNEFPYFFSDFHQGQFLYLSL